MISDGLKLHFEPSEIFFEPSETNFFLMISRKFRDKTKLLLLFSKVYSVFGRIYRGCLIV